MSLGTILLIVLIIVLVGSGPWAGWHEMGWRPSGGIGVVLLVVLILVLAGRL